MFSCIVAFVPTPLPPAGSRAMTTPVRSDPHTEPAAPRAATAVRTRPFALPEVRWAAIATGLFVLGLAAQFGGAPTWLWWTLYLGCYVTGGWEPALAGLQALREKTLDVDLLMIVAAIGAAAIGQVLDGGLLIVIFATSGALEAFLTQRTADSVRSLLDLAPERATVIGPDGHETMVDAASLTAGDVIVVRPGERIGGDAAGSSPEAAMSIRPRSQENPYQWQNIAMTRCSPEPSTGPALCESGSITRHRRRSSRGSWRWSKKRPPPKRSRSCSSRRSSSTTRSESWPRPSQCSSSRSRSAAPCNRRCCER